MEYLKEIKHSHAIFRMALLVTWRKLAITMWTYWSSSSRPEPIKQRCSPLAAEPASIDCFWVANNALAAVANSDGACNICDEKQAMYHWRTSNIYHIIRRKKEELHLPGLHLSEKRWEGDHCCTDQQACSRLQRIEHHPSA